MTATDAPVLEGRRAVVVGDDELGAGIATRLTRAGAVVRLIVCAESVDPGPADAVSPFAILADGSDVDILVLNVLTAATPAPLHVTDARTLAAALGCVALAARWMQALFPALRRRGGRIILIGHRYGESVSEGLAAYNAAAWALVGLTRSAAVDWGQYQITTNLILPFAQTQELWAAREQRPRVIDLLLSQLPLQRAGDPSHDVGGAVVFLASDDACFVNGEVVHADGGQHVAGPVLSPAKFASR